jgi:hypothetical protein
VTAARITGAFRVEEIPGRSRGGRAVVRLLEALEYRVGHAASDELVRVPAGFETDFASIPWGLWNFFPALGPWARPAIVHDWLYATAGLGGRYSRARADDIFAEAMAVVGVPRWRRVIMVASVRLGGGRAWREARRAYDPRL